MKKLALSAIAFLPALLFAQDGKFTVQGKIGSYNAPAKVYLQYRQADKVIADSAVLKDGAFKFTGTTGASPSSAYLLFDAKGAGMKGARDYKDFYIEPGIISITSADLLANSKVDGTATNQDNEALQAALKPVYDGYEAMEAKAKTLTEEQQKSPEYIKQNKLIEKGLGEQEKAVNKKFIQEHPNSVVSLNALQSFTYSADYVDIAPLYEGLSPAIKATKAGVDFGELMPKLKAVALGATAPEFAETDTAGKTVSLSSFRGKYLLIDFWASWCGPCRQENPNVVKAYNQYKGKNFTILGVSLDRPNAKESWLKAIHKDGLTWTQVSDLQFWKSKAAGLYAVRGIPQNFLLDPNGKIIGKNLRGDDLEAKLAELFGKI